MSSLDFDGRFHCSWNGEQIFPRSQRLHAKQNFSISKSEGLSGALADLCPGCPSCSPKSERLPEP